MRLRAVAVLFSCFVGVVCCGAEQTDAPPRGIGLPPRDTGAPPVESDASDDRGSEEDTTVSVGPLPDASEQGRVDAPECTLQSGIAAPPAPAPGLTLIGYSLAGFSGTQGDCGWSYGYVAPATSPSFLLMMQYDATGQAWYVQNGTYWTFMNRDTMHPNGTTTSGGRLPVEHWAVRRWATNVSGRIRITGVVHKAPGATAGNGIIARVVVDGAKLFEQTIIDETGATFDVSADVGLDAPVDFVVDPNMSNDGTDSTYFEGRIWR